MKRIFTLALLTLFFGLSGWSQNYVNYNRDSRWFIGINGGGTFHTQTEVPVMVRGGYGFTFGKSIGMDPGKFFAWDVRFRFLHAFYAGQGTSQYTLDSTSTTGLFDYDTNLQPYQDSIGYFVPNFRTNVARFSLELVLNTNRLRERTGWNFSVFGGIGATGYHTKTDLFDGSGNIYDYNNAGPLTASNLNSFQDNDFETDLVGTDSDYEWGWMPSFGLGISYQLSPAVSIGLEHKMTWTRVDNFDGMPNTFDGLPSSKNDVYHYTSLGFKFHLFGGHVDTDTDVYNFDTTETINTITPVVETPTQKPIIEIYDPGTSPYTTTYNQFVIRANIFYVDGKQNVTFKQNGNINGNFSYDAYSDQFSSSVVLNPGQNLFEISAYNEAGSAYQTTIIIYQQAVPVLAPPIVTITNPPYTPFTTIDQIFGLTSTVLNVDNQSQIQVYLNGTYLSNFNFNASSHLLNSTLSLNEGSNTVTVTATNNAGSDSKTVTIIYTKPAVPQPPIVTYVFPSVDPYSHNSENINVLATVLNVNGQSDITVKVNGNSTTNFSYNITSKELVMNTNLIEGANIVEIKAVNNVGQDIETTTIIYVKPDAPKLPIVTFLDPVLDPLVIYVSNYNVTAKVEHVGGASDITLKINGVVSTSFAFSNSSKLMTFTTNLVEGSNVIEIKGVNSFGQDIESTTIVYKKTLAQAPPVVEITYPATDNQIFNSPNIELLATVLNVASASNIQVLVNGNATTAFGYNTFTKVLNLPLTLLEGSNTIQITGTNVAGTDSKTRLIIYQKPVVPAPPTVAFVNPPSSPFVSTVENFTVTANTTNIDSKSQIVFTMNGLVIPDANYTFTSSHQIIYNSTLTAGNNIFEVTVTNADGTDAALALVTLKLANVPCLIPTVGYISPVPYSTVTNPAINVDAQINNHSVGTTIELKVNGVSQGYMTFNSGTSIASKSTTLAAGSNSIQVIATNECGTNLATFTLTYQVPNAPCVNPTVTAIGSTSLVTQATTISVSAGTTNVPAVSNITATKNGVAVPFNFDLGTGNITIDNAAIAVGNNVIVITVSNACGNAILTYNVVREVCQLPVVSNPSQANGSTTANTSIAFTANVANAIESEITLVVNGISQAFNFNNGTDVLAATLNLEIGANTIAINVTTACGTTTQLVTVNREIPCTPITNNLISPTNTNVTVTDASYSITLNAQGTLTASQITATLNGASVPFTFDPVTGNIILPTVTLNDGMNTIVVTMTNACSSTNVTYQIQYNGCQPPVITITSLANGATVNSSSVAFAASILNSNGGANVTLTVNGTAVSFDFNETNGALTSNILLNEGSNTITLNVNGCQTATQTINVNYVIPCQDVVVSLIQPYTNSLTVTESAFAITLNALNIDNASQISVSQNGTPIAFSFDPGTGTISISSITLINGANTIAVSTTNACSAITTSYAIQYNGCQPPVITLGSSQTNVSTSLYAFYASVTNITDQADVHVLVNGAPVAFVFNPVGGLINAELNLNEGSNTIVVEVTGCQNDMKYLDVTYTVPCIPITFALGTPNSNTTSTADGTYSINLIAQNVAETNITVTANGNVIPFTFINDIISINNIILNPGNNAIVVNLSNACSNETVTYAITFNNCNTPTINLSSNSVATSTASYAFSAIVENIDNQSQLQLTVNGTSVPFTFSAGIVSANLNLNVGSNTINLSATACANASESITVVYTVPCFPVTYSLVAPGQLNTLVQGASTTINLATENVPSNSNISATLNGNTVPFTFTSNVVSLNISNLAEGTNTVVITIGNNCSSETITYTIESDQCETPTVNLTSLNTSVTDPLYSFSCQVYNVNNAGAIQLLVNGTSVNFDFNSGTHNLVAQFSLQVGANNIVVNVNGCETVSAAYVITYSIPCNPITYSLVTPSTNNFTSTNESYSIQLTANNVASQTNIGVFQNGNAVPFTFSGNSISVSGITLQAGANAITVTLTNDCSSETITYTINYNPPAPCLAPVISFTSPNIASDDNYSFTATVTNIDNPSGINVTLNGVPVAANYNTSTDALTCSLTLVSGNNTISVTANGCESTSAVFGVNFTPTPPPCNPPVITFSSGTNVTDANYTLAANVSNVTNASNINITVNGVAIAANYNISTGALSTNITLVEGNNVIVVNANGCAAANGSLTVNYDAPDCGTRINPGNSGWEFCLITPNGTFTRDNLANDINFTYSGSATSLFCKPIAGGGDAFVDGQPYAVSPGQYYLFTGNLNVTVSNDNPNAMGHWVVCIQADNLPEHGNGGNAPTSPCQAPPCNAPVVTITSANTATTASYMLNATVSNIDNPSSISVLVNGVATPAAYNTGTDQLSATINLVEGNNTISIQATGCAVGNGTLTVNYIAPVQDDDIDFDIQGNGTVTVNEQACATIKCLGESVVYNNSQEAYVKVQFSLNGGSSWYGFNNDNNVAGGELVQVATPSGSNIVIKATCTNANNNWSNTLLSNSGSQYVYVLQNGDVAPSFDPAQGQASLETFLAGYIDANGVVTIGPNDVIYLFELRFVGTVGIDYQDCVMLVTLDGNTNCPAPVNPKSSGGSQSGENYLTPQFTTIQPNALASTTSTQLLNFKAKVDNVNLGEDIQITVNGAPASGFSFNAANEELSGNLNLVSGVNTIKIDAVNGTKSATVTYSITYNPKDVVGDGTTNTPPSLTPEFVLISPAGLTESVSSSTYMLKTKVLNVSTKDGVKLTLNGAAVPGFTYSSSTNEVTAVLSLRSGANTIKIDAVNGDKTATISITLNYSATAPVRDDGTNNNGSTTNTGGNTTVTVAPEFRMISPAGPTESVTSSTYMLKTQVTNVLSKSDIKITLNGAALPGFTYSSSTKEVTAVLSLRSGANTIVISATNVDKSASISYTITYTPASTGRIEPENGGNTNGGTTNGGTKVDPTNTGGGTTTTGGGKTTTTTTTTTGGGTTTTGGGTTTTGGGKTTTTTTTTGGGTTTTGGGTTTTGGGKTTTTTTTTGGGTTTTGGGKTTTTTTTPTTGGGTTGGGKGG